MTLFDEIEPTPLQVQRIKELPADQPVLVVSLMRLRRDLADGRAEAAWREWQEAVTPILRDYAVLRIAVAEMLFDMIGARGEWDMIGAFQYPNPKVLWRFMSDERVIDLAKVRRRAAADVHMLVMKPIVASDLS
jgi:hypothetical protein